MPWEILFSYINIWVYFSRVKIWQVISALFSWFYTSLHLWNSALSLCSLFFWPKPWHFYYWKYFYFLKIQGAGEILQIILGQGHFWYFLSELFLLNSPQSVLEAWESALDHCWQLLPGSSPRQGTGHGVTCPCHGCSFLMAPHESWPWVFQTKHLRFVIAILGSGRTRSQRAQPVSISLYLPGLCWKCVCLVESLKMIISIMKPALN